MSFLTQSINFSVPAEVESPNYRTNWGHRAAIADRARTAVRGAVPEKPAWTNYHVRITRVGAGTLDDDNLISACKASRDEIAAWLELDDADPRISFSYGQRKEQVRDATPRAKRPFRTWLEISVSPSPTVPAPLEPPERLIREKTRAPVRMDAMRPPLSSTPVGPTGLTVELAEAPDGRRYVRVCKHFLQQGHAWRTSGVAVELEDVKKLIETLDLLTKPA
jgi:hypothetical protein